MGLSREEYRATTADRAKRGVRWCRSCLSERPVDQFYTSKGKPFSSECKPCSLARFSKHPRTKLSRRFSKVKYKYDISRWLYQGLKIVQKNKCAICELDIKEDGQRGIHVDHNHETGKVRGLLCGWCNHLIAKDAPSHMLPERAKNYLEEDGVLA